jgi:hypothetical protein
VSLRCPGFTEDATAFVSALQAWAIKSLSEKVWLKSFPLLDSLLTKSFLLTVMPDHFYCTDPHGELAQPSGYSSEGITGYVYTSQQPDTIPIYRWRAGNGEHFYCQDSNGEGSGYASEGIGWYMYPNQKPGTTALYRWNSDGDHFYTTDPSGELAGTCGYHLEGILGYLYPSLQSGAVPLTRWLQGGALGFEIDQENQKLRARVYNHKTKETRTSELDLNDCIYLAIRVVYPIRVPTDLDEPEWLTEHNHNLRREYKKGVLGIWMDGKDIHLRWVRSGIFSENVDDLFFDINSFTRRSMDGHIEFIHP